MTPFQSRTEKLAARVKSTLEKLPQEPSAKYVHRIRTSIRRIESLVTYAKPRLGRKQQKSLDEMAILRKRAGKVRDLDVQLKLMGELANGSTAADRRLLGGHLAQKREKQVKRLRSAIRKIAGHKFFAHLERIVGKSGSVAQSSVAAPLSEARNRLALMETEFTPNSLHDPAALHQLRIQLKKLRYVAELAGPAAERNHLIEQLKMTQDALGAWHDWQELSKSADKEFRERVNCPLLVEVRALQAAKQITAIAAVRRLFTQHPELPESKRPRGASSTREMLRRAG